MHNLYYPYYRYVYVGSGPGNIYCPTYNYYYDSPVEDYGEGAVEEASGRNLPEAPPPEPARVLSGAEYFLRLGDEAFKAERYDKAGEAYKQAVESDSESPVARFAHAESLIATGEYHHAAYVIREGLKLDPRWVEVDLDRKTLFSGEEEFTKVQGRLDGYLLNHPFDATAHFVKGYSMYFSGEPKKALEAFRDAVRIQKDDHEAARFIEVLTEDSRKKPGREIVQETTKGQEVPGS